MREAAILGNGPGLTEVALASLPEAALLIGVNCSFDMVWSPIVVTIDTDFCLDMGLPGHRASPTWEQAPTPEVAPRMPYCFVLKNKLDDPGPLPESIWKMYPKWIEVKPGAHRREELMPSGVFAIWYACEVLEIERLYLLGFGGSGHFTKRREPPKGASFDQHLADRNRRAICRKYPEVAFVRVYEDGSHH